VRRTPMTAAATYPPPGSDQQDPPVCRSSSGAALLEPDCQVPGMTFPATAAVHTARVRLAISDASDRTSVVGGGTATIGLLALAYSSKSYRTNGSNPRTVSAAYGVASRGGKGCLSASWPTSPNGAGAWAWPPSVTSDGLWAASSSIRAHVAAVVYYTSATTTAPPRFRSAGPSRLPQQLGNCTSGA
jgi:hypothetical protein